VQIELLDMFDEHRYLAASAYAAVTIAAGYLAVVIATALVRRTRVLA
jgi:hypothetical protein